MNRKVQRDGPNRYT